MVLNGDVFTVLSMTYRLIVCRFLFHSTGLLWCLVNRRYNRPLKTCSLQIGCKGPVIINVEGGGEGKKKGGGGGVKAISDWLERVLNFFL